MKREQVYERDQLTYNEKMDICRKSNFKCCHCGVTKYVNYGATIDHFIPISKGGSNRYLNLVMLCETCNQEKKAKILPVDYLQYLDNKYKEDLAKYVDNYVSVIDYIERNRLLAFDEYSIQVETYRTRNGKKSLYTTVKIKRATYDDLDKLYDYYIKYLKKYNRLDSESAAKQNLIFWLTFGCIYYFEKNNEISIMLAITMKHFDKEEQYRDIENSPIIYIFSYYNTNFAATLVLGIINNLPDTILSEQNLPYIPITYQMVDSDYLLPTVIYYLNNENNYNIDVSHLYGMHQINVVATNGNNIHSYNDITDEQDNKVKEFSNKFNDIRKELIRYFKKYNTQDIKWMILDILSLEDIKGTELDVFSTN